MADKTIKHFVIMRFFSWQSPKYPHDIFDVNFLSDQLTLAKSNALTSLNNQTNKNFELIFVMHPKYFDNPKYEFIFSILRDSTAIPIRFMKNSGLSYLFKSNLNREFSSLIEDTLNEYDFIITSRMDFDDFIWKEAIEDIQSKINQCKSILGYGYSKGYLYVDGEDLHSYYHLWFGTGHLAILQSLILKSTFVKKMPPFTVEDFDHVKFKTELKNFLEKNDVQFSENMFQQNIVANAFIYFRHELSHFNLVKAQPNSLKTRFKKWPKVNVTDVTKKQLEDEFGFTGYELNSIE